MTDSAKLAIGLVLLVIGAGALGYAVGSNGAPDKADAAAARATAQQKASDLANKQAYDAALAKGKVDGQAAGDKAGRADGGTAGFSDAGKALAAERRKREHVQGNCLPFQAFIPGVGCFPPLGEGDVQPSPGHGDHGPGGPGNSENAPGHSGD